MYKHIICFAGILIVTSGYMPVAMAEDFEMIVLTDTREEHDTPPEVEEYIANDERRQAELKRREQERKEHYKLVRRINSDMSRDGYSVVDDAYVSRYDELVMNVKQLSRPGSTTLGYIGTDLSKTAFKRGRKIGQQAKYEDGGVTHNMLYVYEFDDLGVVLVDELSYTTIPDTRITVSKPVGNLTINGYPATYTAVIDGTHEKGLSSMTAVYVAG